MCYVPVRALASYIYGANGVLTKGHKTYKRARFFSSGTIEKAMNEQIYGADLVAGPIRWGLGWALPSKETPITPNWETRRACTWGGAGGSAILIDLDAKVCSTYAMNKMGAPFLPWRDPRSW